MYIKFKSSAVNVEPERPLSFLPLRGLLEGVTIIFVFYFFEEEI